MAMQDLLANAPGRTRKCLEQQLGRIAARNSCRGPWSSSASLTITFDRAKLRMPQRGEISLSLSNPLGAADLLINGSGNLRGWGQNASPDPSLLYVRGFDPATQQYKFEVNNRFGATRPQFLAQRAPVVLTAFMKIDLGPTREKQTLAMRLQSGRTQPGMRYPETSLRTFGTNSLPNPLSTILRQQDSLRLTAMQADSIASMNRRYTYRADSLWTPVARYMAALPNRYDGGEAYDRYIRARRTQIDMLTRIVTAVRELLTPEQLRKLPSPVVNLLDPRYLALVRNGTGMYLAGGGLGSGMGDMILIGRGMGEVAVPIMR
jgi:hypothetical protein